ncbi:Zn(II)2Cys6 transcription factor domain-containing protein [Aspergillus saccharolyticus JOP 1030-1]|uniref:Zn(2)-C6 fungal-type domain-containing protein n=1 Tax=Aspergillus saccharolyticus JOP 1030-1 TaxID=1450539 RepID=A0A318ZL94_9EURO|nr:hypothetical protein BP01DRAFT_360770 [Aspergillus saccharolyticus JOP 1030-1]PYH41008.1 hypothetical protein BP01DRAFT_360770 [Aspergillus saccharolyticus JOP 1030-1]
MQSLAPAPSSIISTPSLGPKVSAVRVRKASAACGECKRLKTKCIFRDKAAACENCTKRHLSCTLDLDRDMRRKSAYKKRIEELTEERDTLLQLFQTLQDSSDANSTTLLKMIRSKSSLSNIQLYLSTKHQQQRSKSAETVDSSQISTETNRHTLSHRVLSIQQLLDMPTRCIPADS